MTFYHDHGILFYFVIRIKKFNFFEIQNLIQFEFWLKSVFDENNKSNFDSKRSSFLCIFKTVSIIFINSCRWAFMKFDSKVIPLFSKSLILNLLKSDSDFFSNSAKSIFNALFVIDWNLGPKKNMRRKKKGENMTDNISLGDRNVICFWFSKNKIVEWFLEKIKRSKFEIERFNDEIEKKMSVWFLIESSSFSFKKFFFVRLKSNWFNFDWLRFDCFCCFFASKKTDNWNFFSKTVRFFRKANLSNVQSKKNQYCNRTSSRF